MRVSNCTGDSYKIFYDENIYTFLVNMMRKQKNICEIHIIHKIRTEINRSSMKKTNVDWHTHP
jgi:hypothetical protein